MLYNYYTSVHESLGLCFWDLPTLVLVLAMVVMILVHHHNQKKREKNGSNSQA